MNTYLLSIKTKIYSNDNEIFEIPTQSNYDDLRKVLLNNENYSIPYKVILSYMNDLGDIVNLDQNSYNDFLQSTDGICYHIETKEIITKNMHLIKNLTWICNHCRATNDVYRKDCYVCRRPK